MRAVDDFGDLFPARTNWPLALETFHSTPEAGAVSGRRRKLARAAVRILCVVQGGDLRFPARQLRLQSDELEVDLIGLLLGIRGASESVADEGVVAGRDDFGLFGVEALSGRLPFQRRRAFAQPIGLDGGPRRGAFEVPAVAVKHNPRLPGAGFHCRDVFAFGAEVGRELLEPGLAKGVGLVRAIRSTSPAMWRSDP